jgi:hypothetical protein
MPKYPNQVIVEFDARSTKSTLADVHALEEALGSALERNGSGNLDGHDFDGVTANIFLNVGAWGRALQVIQTYLRHRGLLEHVRVFKAREGPRERVWPK